MAKILSPFTGLLAYILEKATNPFFKKRFKRDKVNNIAIILLQGIGNTILFLPALKILQKRFSKSKIFVISNRENIELLSAYENIIFIEYLAKKSFFGRLSFLAKIRKISFDLVIYGYPNRYIYPSILCFFLGGYRLVHKYSVGLYKNCDFLNNVSIDFDESVSDVKQNLNLLKPLGIKNPDARIPKLQLPEEAEIKINTYFDNLKLKRTKICLHLGAGTPIKKWPLEHFVELSNQLARIYNCSIIVIGGSLEQEEIKDYFTNVDVPVINVVGNFSVSETAAIIKKCDLLISNDSGPMHIASSVGTPVIALYGPSTDIKGTQPVGKSDSVLSLKLPCSPCVKNNDYVCPLGTHFCLRGLTPQMVLNEISKYIKPVKDHD